MAKATTLSIARAIQNNPLIGFGRVASAQRAKLRNGGFERSILGGVSLVDEVRAAGDLIGTTLGPIFGIRI